MKFPDVPNLTRLPRFLTSLKHPPGGHGQHTRFGRIVATTVIATMINVTMIILMMSVVIPIIVIMFVVVITVSYDRYYL